MSYPFQQDRDTDPLLHTAKSTLPSYGVNQDEDSEMGSTEIQRSSILNCMACGKEHFGTMAVFVLIACLASAVSGMVLGYSSATLLELEEADNNTLKYGIDQSSHMYSLFGSFAALGAIFGAPCASPLSDRFGRKPALMLGGLPAAIGWLMITVAHLAPTREGFLAVLLIGRFFTGFSAGWFVFCVSVYIAEISSAKTKGLFGACNQFLITIGTLIIFILGQFSYKNSYPSFHYYHVSMFVLGTITLFEVLMLFTYETPRWLYAKGRELEGNRVLIKLRGPNADIPKEIRGIKKALEGMETPSFREVLLEFKHRSVFQPFILVFALMFFQQFSGINAAIFYAGSIFKQAQVKDPVLMATLGIGVVQIFATFVSVVLVDYLGRKILLLVSSIGMCTGSAILGTSFLLTYSICKCQSVCPAIPEHPLCHHTGSLGSLAIAGVVVFIISFSLAWGPLPWLTMSELLPLSVRSIGGSIETVVNWTFATIITITFQYYAKLVTPEGAWWSFAFIMFISIFFVFFFLPETKGHTLEEIEDYFDKGHLFAVGFKGGPAPHQAHKEPES